jgi:two-component system LytT family sensor kinase
MKVRWREHEMILTTILVIILLSAYIWAMYNNIPQHVVDPFTNHHAPFNLYRNVLLPDLGSVLLIYLSYLFVNFYIITPFLTRKKEIVTRSIHRLYLWLFVKVVILFILIGAGIDAALYYKHEWQPWNPRDLAGAYLAVLLGFAIFALYIGIREAVIYAIKKAAGKSAYWTLICNHFTGFSVIFITVPFFAAAFHLIHDGSLIAAYFSFVIPAFLVYMVNTYWIFPLKGDLSFFRVSILFRLLVSCFLCTIPFVLFPFHEGLSFAFLSCWLLQLFIVTPITWLLYQLRKDKILQLKGVETALAKSSTDILFLRSQINPHFLFNALNTLYSSALQENAEKTASGIQQLGDMMRFMLAENMKDFIPLEQEIEYLKNFISLQKMRTESSPDIVIEDSIKEQKCLRQIAPMLLIPFVENAFKHGIRLDKKSWIKIRLECPAKEIVFEVRNSKHTKQDTDPEKERTGIGNKNVLERLKLIYPGRYRLSVTDIGDEYVVSLIIRLLN